MKSEYKLDLNKAYKGSSDRGQKYFCAKCQANHFIFTKIGQDHQTIIGNKQEIKNLKRRAEREEPNQYFLPDWDDIEVEADDAKARGWDKDRIRHYLQGKFGGNARGGVDVAMRPDAPKKLIQQLKKQKEVIDSMVDQVVDELED